MTLQPYQLASDVMEDTLTNDKTTVNNAIGHVVMDEEPDFLRESYLIARFTTPTELTDPSVADICGVHLVNLGGVIIAEKTGLSGCDVDQLQDIAVALVNDLPLFSYLVELETVVDGAASKSKMVRYGCHIMQAVTDAINDHMDAYVDECIENTVFAKKPLVIVRGDTTCSLLAVSKVELVAGCNLPNIQTQYGEPTWYKQPSKSMIEIKLEAYNQRNKLHDGLLAGLSDSARDYLIYNGFSVAFTMADDSAEPTVGDIRAIYIKDWKADIVAEQAGLTDLDNAKLSEVIESTVKALPAKGYFVIIESVRRGKNHPITSRSRVKRNAEHLMQGIELALIYLLDEVYDELPSEGEQTIKDMVEKCGKSGETITITINGNTHTVFSVREDKTHSNHVLNNIV